MSDYKIVYKQEALDDLWNAFDYYDLIAMELGNKFYSAFKFAINAIEENPLHYSYINIRENTIYRKIIINKFPFSIVYEVNKREVIIYSVHHFAKQPSNKIPKKYQ